jgi:hypothetical protein
MRSTRRYLEGVPCYWQGPNFLMIEATSWKDYSNLGRLSRDGTTFIDTLLEVYENICRGIIDGFKKLPGSLNPDGFIQDVGQTRIMLETKAKKPSYHSS